MALATDKSVFLHIPKTGGIWVRQAIKECGITCDEIGDQHSHFPQISKLKDKGYYDNKFIFAFVRHPITWYQSRWAFRMKYGWRAQHPLDFNCASNDFTVFVENAIRFKPTGWVTWEYSNYIDTVPGEIDYVGTTENIVNDLITILSSAGERFDALAIRSLNRLNNSDMDGYSSSYWAKYTKDLLNKVLEVESAVIDKYYSKCDIDLGRFCRG